MSTPPDQRDLWIANYGADPTPAAKPSAFLDVCLRRLGPGSRVLELGSGTGTVFGCHADPHIGRDLPAVLIHRDRTSRSFRNDDAIRLSDRPMSVVLYGSTCESGFRLNPWS